MNESIRFEFDQSFTKWKIMLASTSPRRKEILEKFFKAEDRLIVVPSEFDESVVSRDLAPGTYVESLSRCKAEAVFPSVEMSEDALIVAADTMIVRDQTLVGKPDDAAHAKEILQSLVGRRHLVLTGVCILNHKGEAVRLFHEITEVFFDHLSDSTLDWYISTGEPFGKAGAYGIQGIGSMLVKEIRGCFWNVMGFPINRFLQELSSI